MNKKIENKFIETTDYTRFKKTRGNRPVDEAHVAQLKKLIADKDLYDPIRVNKNMEVIDGQHTLEARKQLDLIDHDFYVFRNKKNNELQVIYKRNHGGYGLIQSK